MDTVKDVKIYVTPVEEGTVPIDSAEVKMCIKPGEYENELSIYLFMT